MIGQVVGQYKILEKLGEGGMGTVYKGIDVMVEREVAIKMLRPEIARQPELVERFRSEAVTLAKLNSPGIAILYNFFRQGDDFFMVMEFVAGRTLEALIRDSGAMPWDRAVSLFCKILEAIEPAHQAGILHRDIKPSNIMLTPNGGVKVMDFGIARVLGAARMTREGRMVGTIEYIAPERIKGIEADARADIYSLGVVLYEMLTGRLPFQSDSEFEIMRGHVQDAPPTLLQFDLKLPAGVEAVVMMSLAKPPDQRIQSCAAFLADLQFATQGLMPARNSAVYTTAGTLHPLAPPTSMTSGAEQETRLMSSPHAPTANVAARSTGAKATRYEPVPSAQYVMPQTAPAHAPTPVTMPVASKPGFLAQLNWKHYAAAGAALLVIVALTAILIGGKSKTAAAAPETPVVTQAPTPPPVSPAVSPAVTPAASVTPAIPPPAQDTPAIEPSANPGTPLVTDASIEQERAAKEDARAKAAARKKALKALDEQ